MKIFYEFLISVIFTVFILLHCTLHSTSFAGTISSRALINNKNNAQEIPVITYALAIEDSCARFSGKHNVNVNGYVFESMIAAKEVDVSRAVLKEESRQMRKQKMLNSGLRAQKEVGHIGIYHKSDDINSKLFVMIGTKKSTDWILDLKVNLVNFTSYQDKSFGENVMASEGSVAYYKLFREKLIHYFQSNKISNLVIAGYGLGASSSQMLWMDLHHNNLLPINAELYLYASPRTGNLAFVNKFISTLNTNMTNITNVVNERDLVTKLPTDSIGYSSIPMQHTHRVCFYSKNKLKGVSYMHNIHKYTIALRYKFSLSQLDSKETLADFCNCS